MNNKVFRYNILPGLRHKKNPLKLQLAMGCLMRLNRLNNKYGGKVTA